MQKFNQIRRQLFKKTNTTNKFLARLMKKGKTQKKYGLSMTPREGFMPHCPGFLS